MGNDGTNQVVAVLSNRRCRELLAHLHKSDGELFELKQVANAMAKRGNDGDDVLREQPDQLAIELHHHYLPKLAQAGLVEFDARTGDIRYRGEINDPALEILLFGNAKRAVS